MIYCLSTLVLALVGRLDAICTVPAGETPEICTMAGATATDTEQLQCGQNYDCCLCALLTCGPTCEEFQAGGDFSVFNTTVTITGAAGEGAEVDCDGDNSCQMATITGTNIKDLNFGGDFAFASGILDATCLATDGCTMECTGDNSCQDAMLTATNVKEVKCHGDMGCAGATLTATCLAAEPCQAECTGEFACMGATIALTNVKEFKCGGESSCAESTVTITNPGDEFKLECDGQMACRNMTIVIVVTDPSSMIESIECTGFRGCAGLDLSIENQLATTVMIESIICDGDACNGAMFGVAAASTGAVVAEQCECSGSGCGGATTTIVCQSGSLDASTDTDTETETDTETDTDTEVEVGDDDDDDSSGSSSGEAAMSKHGLLDGEIPRGAAANGNTEEYITISFSDRLLENMWALTCVLLLVNVAVCCVWYRLTRKTAEVSFPSSNKASFGPNE